MGLNSSQPRWDSILCHYGHIGDINIKSKKSNPKYCVMQHTLSVKRKVVSPVEKKTDLACKKVVSPVDERRDAPGRTRTCPWEL